MFTRSPFAIVDAEQTMDTVLKHGVDVQRTLRRLGFPDCSACSVRFDETLEEAVLNYGLDLERVLMTLNAVLTKTRVRLAKNDKKEKT